ncbi:MAG TPA: SDR family oxidoreductase [Acidimicrobiia bacterium]|nr:SDR family oxidoreductase [Acidimicrobiia bacterium]
MEKLTRDEAIEIAKDPFHTRLDPSDILLTDQVAVVTGGGGGIGMGIALGLAKFGADVAVLDIVPERTERAVEAIGELGRTGLALPTDVMDTDQIRAAIARTHERFGRIDILVNNAGGVRGAKFVDQSERSWRRHIDINLVSMLAATSATVPHMIESGGGSIVNVTSIEGFRAAPMYSVYAACKAGMINFTRTLAVELGEYDIRVNAIAPDLTTTPGLRGNRTGPVDPSTWVDFPSTAADVYLPLRREGVVEDCAGVAVFLCSSLGGYITGTTLNVDGGSWASSGWNRDGSGGWTLH